MLLTEYHFEFLSLKGGCISSSESTLVKMPYCWKSHVVAHIWVRDLTGRVFFHWPFGSLLYSIQGMPSVRNSGKSDSPKIDKVDVLKL